MKNRTSLALIEQSIMLLVFAVAAALCLQAFLWADRTAKASVALDQAVVHAQWTAEQLKQDAAAVPPRVEYDADWNVTEADGAYVLEVRPEEPSVEGLKRAQVAVSKADGGAIFALTVAWQEVTP